MLFMTPNQQRQCTEGNIYVLTYLRTYLLTYLFATGRCCEGTTYSEDELTEIMKVKDLKIVYQEHFDELQSIKAEVEYCEKLVDQCRQQLIRGMQRAELWSLVGWSLTSLFSTNTAISQTKQTLEAAA